jgi:D-alanine-D-alanine ligase
VQDLRIGFAYNQKPDDDAPDGASADEPPSRRSHDRFAEWDAPATIDAVAAALARAGTVIRLEANEEFPARLRQSRPDIVFNIAEGLHGPNREAHVPAICEFLGIPHTASDPLTLALAHHKARAKQVFAAHGVATPAWCVAQPDAPAALPGDGPWIVKPVHEGSSMGIAENALCHDAHAVAERVRAIDEQYAQPALVEVFLSGREFTVAIIGNGAEAHALPIVEIALSALPAGAAPIYGYEAKWLWDVPEQPLPIFACPADVDDALARTIEDTALRAYAALGCRDWARVDVRLDTAGAPHVLEINPLPGILPDPRQNSCFPKAARAAGLDYDTLILSVLDAALRRTGLRR